MADFDLNKNDVFDLTKHTGGAKAFYFGLGWDTTADLDFSLFACKLDANGDPALVTPQHLAWYNNLTVLGGAIIHSPDNRDGQDTLSPTGRPTKDDEWAQVYIDKLETADQQVVELACIVTIHEGVAKGITFDKIKDAFIRVCQMGSDGEPTTEILKFKLDESAKGSTAAQFGSLVKDKTSGNWSFQAGGDSFPGVGLGEVIKQYYPGASVAGG